jgi:ribonuclease VapC
LIVLDSSAIIAILTGEQERQDCLSAIQAADRAVMSAVNVHESGIVMRSRLGQDGLADLLELLTALAIEVVPFDADDARLAIIAFERFGKGIHSDSKARLNLCDCAAYALAARLDAPLLFKGDDFTHTDIDPVLRQSG